MYTAKDAARLKAWEILPIILWKDTKSHKITHRITHICAPHPPHPAPTTFRLTAFPSVWRQTDFTTLIFG